MSNELLLRRLPAPGAGASASSNGGAAGITPQLGGGGSSAADSAPELRLAVAEGQPRSVAVALLAGCWFLCIGTAAGELLYMPLSWAPGSGGLRVGPGRRLTVGISGVSLQSVPGRAGLPAHVYAQSDQGLCLGARREASEQGAAFTPQDHFHVVIIRDEHTSNTYQIRLRNLYSSIHA